MRRGARSSRWDQTSEGGCGARGCCLTSSPRCVTTANCAVLERLTRALAPRARDEAAAVAAARDADRAARAATGGRGAEEDAADDEAAAAWWAPLASGDDDDGDDDDDSQQRLRLAPWDVPYYAARLQVARDHHDTA